MVNAVADHREEDHQAQHQQRARHEGVQPPLEQRQAPVQPGWQPDAARDGPPQQAGDRPAENAGDQHLCRRPEHRQQHVARPGDDNDKEACEIEQHGHVPEPQQAPESALAPRAILFAVLRTVLLGEQPGRDRAPVPDDRCRQHAQCDQQQQRRDAAPGMGSELVIDDRHDQQLAIADQADDDVEHPPDPARATVRQLYRPELADHRRQHAADRHLDRLDRQKGVEVEALPDADLADLAEDQHRQSVSGSPGDEDDRGVDHHPGDDDQAGAEDAHRLRLLSHPAKDRPGDGAEDQEEADRRGDHQREVDQRPDEKIGVDRAEAGEDGRRALQPIPERQRPGGDQLGERLRLLRDPAAQGQLGDARRLRDHPRAGLRVRRRPGRPGEPLELGDQRLARRVVAQQLGDCRGLRWRQLRRRRRLGLLGRRAELRQDRLCRACNWCEHQRQEDERDREMPDRQRGRHAQPSSAASVRGPVYPADPVAATAGPPAIDRSGSGRAEAPGLGQPGAFRARPAPAMLGP